MADKKRRTSQPVAKPASGAGKTQPANRVIAAPQKSRTPLFVTAGVVLVAVIALIVILAAGNNTSKKAAAPVADSVSQAVIARVTSVPAASFDAAGPGGESSSSVFKKITGDPLTADGKPEVLYIGAEFCPFCGSERWSMITALSRFGTFSNLSLITSSENNVPSFTFLGATYTSQYFTFTHIENLGQKHEQTEPLTAAQDALWGTLTNNQRSFPFIDVGGKYTLVSGVPPATVINPPLSHNEISIGLSVPLTPVGKAILAGANTFTAAICSVTGNQPSDVCDSASIKAAIALLPTK